LKYILAKYLNVGYVNEHNIRVSPNFQSTLYVNVFCYGQFELKVA